jgi:hypothetical protein
VTTYQSCQIKFFENCQKELKIAKFVAKAFFHLIFAVSTYYFTKQKWAKAKNCQMAIFAIEIPMIATEAQKSPKWRKIAKPGTTATYYALSLVTVDVRPAARLSWTSQITRERELSVPSECELKFVFLIFSELTFP